MTTRILDVRADDLLPDELGTLPPFDAIQWMSVLKSLTGYQMYRRHVRTRIAGPDVLAFLLRDPQFPRAVMFGLGALEALLRDLPGEDDRALRSVTRMARRLNELDLEDIQGERLGELMDQLQLELAEIHSAIRQTWFPAE